jgi:hypothetical protein
MTTPLRAVPVELIKTLGPSAGALVVVLVLLVPIVRDMLGYQMDTVEQLGEMNGHLQHMPAEVGQAVADELRYYDYANGATYLDDGDDDDEPTPEPFATP